MNVQNLVNLNPGPRHDTPNHFYKPLLDLSLKLKNRLTTFTMFTQRQARVSVVAEAGYGPASKTLLAISVSVTINHRDRACSIVGARQEVYVQV